MKVLKVLLILLCLPLLLYLHFLFAYFGNISLILVLSVFVFKDLKLFNYWWCLPILAIFIDAVFYYWIGTFLLSVVIVFIVLELANKFISNFLFEIVYIFVGFFIFRIFLYFFTIFQETLSFNFLDTGEIIDSLRFALFNLLLYLFIRLVHYFLNSYFRNEGYKI